MSRPWVRILIPVAVFALLIPAAYAYAWANPLPWKGYGHTVLHLNSTLKVPAGSQMTVRILGDMPIPAKSFVWTQVYVLTRGPDDNPITADFQFAYNDETSAAVPGWGMKQQFETRVGTQGALNPEYVISNPAPVDIVVLEYGWVTVPPTTGDHFGLLLPWVLIIGCMLAFGIDRLVAFGLRPPRRVCAP